MAESNLARTIAMEPELSDTINWLRTLPDVADELRQLAETPAGPRVAESVRKALDRVEYLNTIDRELPRIHRVLLAQARRETDQDDDAKEALRTLQEALVDVARAMIYARTANPGAFSAVTLPPYDQWLPFKDGLGVH